jgi:hypothetical protein
MTQAQHQRLTSVGFACVYCALMAWMVITTTEFLTGIRTLIVFGLLLPVGIIGGCLIAYARLRYRPRSYIRKII